MRDLWQRIRYGPRWAAVVILVTLGAIAAAIVAEVIERIRQPGPLL